MEGGYINVSSPTSSRSSVLQQIYLNHLLLNPSQERMSALENDSAELEVPQSHSLFRGDGPLTEWELPDEEGEPDNTEGDLAGLADDSSQPAIVSKPNLLSRQAPAPKPKYNPDPSKLPEITKDNDNKLPGVFFFLTVTWTDEKKSLLVAYDPFVTNGTSVKELISYYRANRLPYHEVFEDNPKSKWTPGHDVLFGESLTTVRPAKRCLLIPRCIDQSGDLGRPLPAKAP